MRLCCVTGEGLSGIGTASKLSGLNTAAAAVNTQVRYRVEWGVTTDKWWFMMLLCCWPCLQHNTTRPSRWLLCSAYMHWLSILGGKTISGSPTHRWTAWKLLKCSTSPIEDRTCDQNHIFASKCVNMVTVVGPPVGPPASEQLSNCPLQCTDVKSGRTQSSFVLAQSNDCARGLGCFADKYQPFPVKLWRYVNGDTLTYSLSAKVGLFSRPKSGDGLRWPPKNSGKNSWFTLNSIVS